MIYRILVIDDDEAMRLMLETYLTVAGYEVLMAANGNEGLKVFSSVEIDLVVTDIIMPDREGLSTIRELRKISSDLKIIALSGDGLGISNLQVASMMGASRAFTKPVEMGTLCTAIRELLEDASQNSKVEAGRSEG